MKTKRRRNYSFLDVVQSSERSPWGVDDVMPPGTRLDFTQPFLPERLSARVDPQICSGPEGLVLNQIGAHSYLHLFSFVEEYIIGWGAESAADEIGRDKSAMRALLRLTDDELKHQELFERYMAAFHAGFGHPCELVDDAEATSKWILSHHPLAVLLLTLQLEIVTQAHYVGCVKDDADLDPFFSSLLKHHWIDESHHVRTDILQLRRLASNGRHDLEAAGADFDALLGGLAGLLRKQAVLDIDAYVGAVGSDVSDTHRKSLLEARENALVNSFIEVGLAHPTFARTVEELFPDLALQRAAAA